MTEMVYYVLSGHLCKYRVQKRGKHWLSCLMYIVYKYSFVRVTDQCGRQFCTNTIFNVLFDATSRYNQYQRNNTFHLFFYNNEIRISLPLLCINNFIWTLKQVSKYVLLNSRTTCNVFFLTSLFYTQFCRVRKGKNHEIYMNYIIHYLCI